MSGSYFELPHAVSNFRAAIEIDPTYAPAHAGLALTCCAQAGLRSVPHREAYAQAKTSALRALALDDACADAQVALGTVLFLSEWDWVGAEKSLRRALEINSAHSEALLHYGSLMEALGKPDQGLQFKQQALERDPRSPLVLVQIASSVLASTAVRRRDRVGEQGTGSGSAAPAGRGVPRRRLLETRRHRPFSGGEPADAPKSSACPSRQWRTCSMCVPGCRTLMPRQGLEGWPATCSNRCLEWRAVRRRCSARSFAQGREISTARSSIWIEPSMAMTPPSSISPWRRNGTACVSIPGSTSDWHE